MWCLSNVVPFKCCAFQIVPLLNFCLSNVSFERAFQFFFFFEWLETCVPLPLGPKGRFCYFDADSDFAKHQTVEALCSACTYETHSWHHAYVTVGRGLV